MSSSVSASQDQRKLSVLGRFGYGSIPMITQFVADAAQEARLDEDAVFHCQMAVDEACTNVIEHAYGEDPNGNFEVSCWIERGKVTIQIVDQGKSFDPTTAPAPKMSANLDEIRPGGVGIHLIKKLMDEVRFERTERGNVLTLVKIGQPLAEHLVSTGIPVREESPGVWVVAPIGQVDSLIASDLDQTLSDLVSQGRNHLVIDLAEVTYMSSKGIKALVSGWRQARDSGGEFILCAIAPRVQAIIDTIGLGQIFAIHSTLSDALTAISAVK